MSNDKVLGVSFQGSVANSLSTTKGAPQLAPEDPWQNEDQQSESQRE